MAWKHWSGAVAASLLVVSACSEASSQSGSRVPTPIPPFTATQVCIAAHEAVKGGLKAPSTAKFPDNFCRDVATSTAKNAEGRTVWTVSGPVDAQNTFGAMIRSTYTVEITDLGDGNNYRQKVISIE
jgi:hypothetical protein